MKATLVYTLSRLALFFAVAAVGYLFGLRGLPLILIALLVSGIASIWLLSAQRDAMSEQVVRARDAMDAATAKEDVDDVDATAPADEAHDQKE